MQHLEEDLLQANRHFHSSQQTLHKERNELRMVTIAGEEMVIKSYKPASRLTRLMESRLHTSKAKSAYENAIKLQQLPINTPSPVAFVDSYDGPTLSHSYYIMLFEPFDFTMRAVLHHDIKEHEKILKAFTKFTFEMHQKEALHTDHTSENIIVLQGRDGYRFSIVDIHRVEFHPVTPMEGIRSFASLGANDEDLAVIAKEYARLCGIDLKETYTLMKRESAKARRLRTLKRLIRF